jgi:hypothetical protein
VVVSPAERGIEGDWNPVRPNDAGLRRFSVFLCSVANDRFLLHLDSGLLANAAFSMGSDIRAKFVIEWGRSHPISWKESRIAAGKPCPA